MVVTIQARAPKNQLVMPADAPLVLNRANRTIRLSFDIVGRGSWREVFNLAEYLRGFRYLLRLFPGNRI